MKNLTWLNAIEYIETHEDDYAAQIIATMRQNFTKVTSDKKSTQM